MVVHCGAAATNLVLWSQDPTNVTWNKALVTAAAGVTTAPDGTATGNSITATAGAGFHYVRQAAFTFATAIYTHSVFVKRNNNDWIFITVDDGSVSYFNLATGVFGTVASGVTATPRALANGWYRLSVTQAEAAGSRSAIGLGLASGNNGASFTATGTESVLIWGDQVEQSPFASSYIPTTSAVASRTRGARGLTASTW